MKKLRKTLFAVTAVALLSLLTGCGGSPEATLPADSSFTTLGGDPAPTDPAASGELVLATDGCYRVLSPEGGLRFNLLVSDTGALSYNLTDSAGTVWIADSALGCTIDSTKFFTSDPIVDVGFKAEQTSYPLIGNFSSADDRYTDVTFTLERGSYRYALELRLFEDGAAFRYNLPKSGSRDRRVRLDSTTFVLREDVTRCWYGVENQDYEPVIESHSPDRASKDRIMPPLTAEVKGGGYIALMESDASSSYGGTGLIALGKGSYRSDFFTTPEPIGGDILTAWKLVNIAPDLNSLVANNNVYSLCAAADPELYGEDSWIVPGRSTWSWGVSHSAPSLEQMLAYTEAAAKLGFEYNIVDDGWPAWSDWQSSLEEIGAYGDDVGVRELLWGAITAGTSGKNRIDSEAAIDRYLGLLEDCHFDGAKVDFWWSEANFNTTRLQKYILEQSARRQMIIDFHGCNKNTGLNRTYPNELSREGIRGLENIGLSANVDNVTYAKWLTAQLFTRYLCGHADWTPGCETAMQIASIICIDSPLMVLAADPEAILESDAVEFIKSIPTAWDRTVVLPGSEIGKYAAYAKESKGVWFVGGISAGRKTSVSLELSDFLPSDVGVYLAEIITGGKNLKITRRTVSAGESISIGNLSAGEGYAIRLSKLELSQNGGAIGEPIELTLVDPSARVRYTTDGSDPLTSATAADWTGPLTLTENCRLTVAIIEGDGRGSVVSYSFCDYHPASIDHQESYGDGRTTVTLLPSEGETLYYTVDQSEPTTASTVYTAPFTLSESAKVRVLIVDGKGRERQTSFAVRVTARIRYTMPDLLLTSSDALSASGPASNMGWGIPRFNEANFNDTPSAPSHKISLGGQSSESGTLFESGLSCNAVATFRYAVPERVRRFVAVVGIDDCTFDNPSGGDASASCRIAFDGATVYSSEVFRRGEYVLIDIEVPENAGEITITFADGGNGITCDNVSMGDPGWIR